MALSPIIVVSASENVTINFSSLRTSPARGVFRWRSRQFAVEVQRALLAAVKLHAHGSLGDVQPLAHLAVRKPVHKEEAPKPAAFLRQRMENLEEEPPLVNPLDPLIRIERLIRRVKPLTQAFHVRLAILPAQIIDARQLRDFIHIHPQGRAQLEPLLAKVLDEFSMDILGDVIPGLAQPPVAILHHFPNPLVELLDGRCLAGEK